MSTSYPDEVARTVVRHVEDTGTDLAALGLTEIAAIMGVSRSTLIRRIGHRGALDDAFARQGTNTAREFAADRAVAAAARLYSVHGVGEVTLEMVAREAACTVQAVQGQLKGRDGLLIAVFDRYSPIGGVEAVLADLPDDLEDTARRLYATVLDALVGDTPVMTAMFAELASRPNGVLAEHVRRTYVPRFTRAMTGWLTRHNLARLPNKTLLSLFAGPVIARSVAAMAGGEHLTGTERDQLAADLAHAFSNAVSVPAGE